MDSIEITTELNKINRVHGSLDETNPITYIIFQETFRDRLTESQHAWLDDKITRLNNKASTKLELAMKNIDIGLAMADIRDKFVDSGIVRVINGASGIESDKVD